MQGNVRGRFGRRLSIGVSAWILAAGILGAGPAAGTPMTTCTPTATQPQCTVFFSGPDGFGLNSGDATLVSTELGIPILTAGELFETSGTLAETIFFDPVTDLDPFPPSTSDPILDTTATTEWTIRNITGSPGAEPARDLIGNVYYLFVGFGEKDENGDVPDFEDPSGNKIEYGSTDLGLILPSLILDPFADPWVILEAFDSTLNQTVFYPAVDLGSMASGAEADPFDVGYFIDGPVQEPLPSIFVLPQFQVGAGFTVIPEPETALLLGLGLAGLAGTRPRRP